MTDTICINCGNPRSKHSNKEYIIPCYAFADVKTGTAADYMAVLAEISNRALTGSQKSQARRIAAKLSWFYGVDDVLIATNGVTLDNIIAAAIETVPGTIDQQEAQAEQAPFDF